MVKRALEPVLLLVLFAILAMPIDRVTADSNTSLERFLRGHLGKPNVAVRFTSAIVHLGGGTPEIIVYLDGDGWCGSGGCPGLLLKPEGQSYKIIDKFLGIHLPMRMLPTTTNGWRDLTVWVHGGGIVVPYQAWLRFDGRRYPPYPTTAPHLPKSMSSLGEDVRLSGFGTQLWR